MSFLDKMIIDEVPCDYKRIAKKLGNKYIRLRKKLRIIRSSHWEFVRILRWKIAYQKREIRVLRKALDARSKGER